jgi:hypothetical protein
VTVPLAKPRYAIGRGAESDVRLDERTVSRRHAVLTRDEAGTWWVDDAGSTHGTYVNGRLIRTRTPLAHNACVQVGDVLVTVRDTTGAATGAVPGRFEPVKRFLRADPATGDDGGVRLVRAAADAPARLILLQGPGVGSVLRLDGGPVTLGGVPGSTLRLDEPGCEAVDVVLRPVAGQGFEMVRRGGPVKVYVSVRTYERRLLWNNDVLFLEHDDGRMLCEVRYREAGSAAAACLPGTPLPVGTEVDGLPPSWAYWLRSVPPKPPALAEANGSTEGPRADAVPEPEPRAPDATRADAHAAQVDAVPVPAPRPSEARSERRARRAAGAVLATSLALVAAVGLWLGTRGPVATTPEAAVVPAARPTLEARSAAVEPTVEPANGPPVEGPASPGAALANTVQTHGAGAQRIAAARAPKEHSTPEEESDDEARQRARLESKAHRGTVSAVELIRLRKLCEAQNDEACLRRTDTLAKSALKDLL